MVNSLLLHFEEYDRRIFCVLVTLSSIAVIAYLYFLSISVYSVIGRRSADKEISNITINISLLESQYVAVDNKISLELAHTKGFYDISVPRFISRDGSHDTLTLRSENQKP